MASGPSKSYLDLASSACVQGTSLRALEPGALSFAPFQAWAGLTRTQAGAPVIREALCW